MAYRDQLSAMQARIEFLEGELASVRADHRAEKLRLERELAEARLELAREREAQLEGEPPTSNDSVSPKKSGVSVRGALIVALVASVVVAGVVALWIAMSETSEGGITVTEGKTSSQMSIEDCSSGKAYVPRFFGVVLTATDQSEYLVTEDYLVLRSRDRAMTDKVKCERFDVDFEWAGVEINDVDAIDGTISLDCTVDGVRTVIEAKLENCH